MGLIRIDLKSNPLGPREYVRIYGVMVPVDFMLIRHDSGIADLFIGHVIRNISYPSMPSFGYIQFKVMEHYVMFM